MSKLLAKLKELSSKLNGSKSKEPKSKSDTEVEEKQQHGLTAGSRQLKSGLRHAKSAIERLKKLNIPKIPSRLQVPNLGKKRQQPPMSESAAALIKFSSPSPSTSAAIKPTGSKLPLKKYLLLLAGVGVGSGAIALGVAWFKLDSSVPKFTKDDLVNYVRPGTLTIKSANGTILQQNGPATHDNLKIGQVPKTLIQAFIATEDRRFYQHQGVDYQGILRATVSNLQANGVVEGGSTLTQQLARMMFLDQQRSLTRKLKEYSVAQKIEQKLDKDQIIDRYLNLVYLGEGAYGVADAAWVYFSKPVGKLTLPEMAMLAGLPAAPNDYSPLTNKKIALERRNQVLQRMQDAKYITEAEAKAAEQAPLVVHRSNPKNLDRQAIYFTQYIQQELPKYVSPKVLKVGGLTVETTLNPEWQKAAEEAVSNTIKEDGRGARFSEGALVAIEPRTGQIKTMVGGKDFYHNQFNRVTQAKRQPGSTFKMFVYATAIAAGFTPTRGYNDAPLTVDGYKPKNYSEHYYGWISMRDALTNSINMVAVQVLIDVGWKPTIDLAHKMGIESDLKRIYSLALGGSEVNLLELTSAYGTLAFNGVHAKPHGISRIIDRHGKIIYEDKIVTSRALDEETSAIMTWMLRGVVNEGTGKAAALAHRPVAGKTGTSDEARDLWFIGYIPQLVTGVWLGNDNNKPTLGASSIAADTWSQFMSKAVKGMRTEQFPKRPDNLEGRKPKIKVQPIHPRYILFGKTDEEKKESEKKSSNDSSKSQRERG